MARERQLDSPTPSRGRGVLIVSPHPEQRARLRAALGIIDADVVESESGHAALDMLRAGVPPDVVLLDSALRDITGLALCRQIRASAALATTYVLVLSREPWQESELERAEADDYLQHDAPDFLLRSRVRTALRAQAHRRVLARRERRRAVEWLGSIVAHELNNPLAVALTGMECMRDILRAPAPDAVRLTELRRWVAESDVVLRRIHDTAVRLTQTQDELAPGGATDTPPQVLVDLLQTSLRACFHGALTLHTDLGDDRPVRLDRQLLLDAVQAVTKAAAPLCHGALNVTLAGDRFRIAVILEFAGAPEFDPESILEPRLQSTNNEPPIYAPGLSVVEQAFARFGGQIFARPHGSLWRFGLTLPLA